MTATVKRYTYDADNEHMEPELFGTVVLVPAADHDRVVAVLEAEIASLRDQLQASQCAEKMSADIVRDLRQAVDADRTNAAAGVEPSRWVPWKPGDALPVPNTYRVATMYPDGAYHYVDLIPEDFNGWFEFSMAYWSIPLPPPYVASQAERGEPAQSGGGES